MKKQTNNEPSPNFRVSQFTPEGIQDQLNQVLSSPEFKASKKVETIFRYLTKESSAGREDQISVQRIAAKAPSSSTRS